MSDFSVTIPRWRGQSSEARSLENPAIPVSPAQLDSLWGYGPTRSGIQINEQTALTFTAVFAAIKILAESIGMLSMAIFEGDEDGERRRAREHPAYNLLAYEPNQEMSAAVFFETVQGHMAGWGNGYCRIIRNRAEKPIQLLPMLPSQTHIERKAGNLVYKAVDGGEFAPEEVLHIPALGFNGIKGYSPIAMAREAIAMGKAAEIFGATFYGNGANIGGVFTHPKAIGDSALQRLRGQIAERYSGVGNANKFAVLEEGMGYTRTGIPPDEAQFIESRKFQVVEVARIFRVPPHMMMDLERSTNNNIGQQSLEFLIYTLSPWITKWEQEVTRKLCGTGSGYFARFDIRRLLRNDLAAKQSYYAAGRQWGYFSANDVRREEDLPPIDGGDTYLSPVNMVPADMMRGGAGYSPPPPPPPADKDKIERSLRAVAIDAVSRMLRKESNARSRANFDPDKFYPEHATHVREALAPFVRSAELLGCNVTKAQSSVELFAKSRGNNSAPDALGLADLIADQMLLDLRNSP